MQRLVVWMQSSLRRRSALMIVAVMVVLLGVYITYDVISQRNTTEDVLLAKGKSMAVGGAAAVTHVLEDAIASGRLSEAQVFDTSYQPISGTNPQKYHTAYDAFTDANLQALEDSYLQDADIVFAIATDTNGYIPTHNSVFSKPLTGNQAQDMVNNRTKRIFNDPTGLAAAQNTQPFLRQIYKRDTGETMWDISAPVIVNGKHWGAFRVGFSLIRVDAYLANVTRTGVFSALFLTLAVALAAYLITRPMSLVTDMSQIAEKVSKGDSSARVSIKRRDEIGVLAGAFNLIIQYNREMAEAADRLANGDLTVNIHPRSEDDLLGKSFSRMIDSLREIIGNINQNASRLEKDSSQLSAYSSQANVATDRISLTIQQVSQGVSQEAEMISKSAGAMEQLDRAIYGVASGARHQAEAAENASQITARINNAIAQVMENAHLVSESSSGAAESARLGVNTVNETIHEMYAVKEKVGITAEKITDMGQRSQEIGRIVETIEEIASQTNLLALNAAIEAARAGEHGKGFSVVADEVRKLAERSALSTKEIAALITGIRQSVDDSVSAMQSGAVEVENGVIKADQAGKVLDGILKAVETVYFQAEQVASVTEGIRKSTEELVDAMDTVSAVIEENTASTEEMSANSREVTQSIENFAGISKENSTSVKQVSSATEEVASQVAEVNKTSRDLAEMVIVMRRMVDQFKLKD
ncbi:MAG: methyl-accepting chemotaxis protein [Anaerolineae bacterium]|nr:methyl-accepting chemotaxis protein [Anaerolineae bacterium]